MSDAPNPAATPTRRERRDARRLWRQNILARATSGESRQQLADGENVSLSTVKRALARARAEQPPVSRKEFVARQRDRLERAVRLAEARIEEGDLAAAYVLIQLLPLLDSCEAKLRGHIAIEAAAPPRGVGSLFDL